MNVVTGDCQKKKSGNVATPPRLLLDALAPTRKKTLGYISLLHIIVQFMTKEAASLAKIKHVKVEVGLVVGSAGQGRQAS